MALDHYYTLGRSGLRVSRMALGTMTFGNAAIRGISGSWGSADEISGAIFDHYTDMGGNFIDTANSYGAGASESLIGQFMREKGNRERLVLATKYSNSLEPGNPNAGGNSRKAMMRAVEDSLRRLGTDYIDLYMVHTWDRITPAEEVVRTLDDLVRAGKIRYGGLSDVPAWYAARAQTWAECHALTPLISLQLPYSLAERNIEQEFVPLAQNMGLGITVWSPLSMGLLSGKYRVEGDRWAGEGRLTTDASGKGMGLFTARNHAILSALQDVAAELERPMAQVALSWVLNRPSVASLIIGASKLAQLQDNIAAFELQIPAELSARLDAASALPSPQPYALFDADYQAGVLNTGTSVGDKPASYAPPQWMPKVDDFTYGKG
ncbi:aldo/keto reductase [Pseudochrobactrum sp. XF203]|uniref:aldo/keto reductase n=1 Tax=Pseudochrobactrum sp. XF203 TaxID=2879116 RepID=UPI001CE3033D|nr:aldo/keto reductase [Pseudochrobactrum sp. XF203]UCA44343.1 aldo/keto reductase [Pseudochrobactrum sp. XF203]